MGGGECVSGGKGRGWLLVKPVRMWLIVGDEVEEEGCAGRVSERGIPAVMRGEGWMV